jgi:hypothetical protein
MRQRVRRFFVSVGFITAIGLATAPRAEASLILAGTVGATNICATDNNVACSWGTQLFDLDPTVGSLLLGAANIGGLTFQGSLQTAIATPVFDVLNSSSLSVTNTTAAPISAMFAVSATNFDGPVDQTFASGSGTWVIANGSAIQLSWYNDPQNAQGAETPTDRPGTLVASFADVAVGLADSFSFNSGPVPVNDPALYSMTLAYDFTLAPRAIFLSRGQVELKDLAVPEPASFTLLAMALGAAAMRRRKRG